MRPVYLTFILMMLVGAGCKKAAEEAPQVTPEPVVSLARAAAGDTVWVILNHVKYDKREQFERYVEEILIPAVDSLAVTDTISKSQTEQTRTLYPTELNEDSTYTYVWLMDPLVSGADYSFEGIFGRVYTPEQVKEYIEMFDDALDRPQEGYVVIQKRDEL